MKNEKEDASGYLVIIGVRGSSACSQPTSQLNCLTSECSMHEKVRK